MADTDRDSGGFPRAERRLLTILFSDLKDYTKLAEAYEPEDVFVVIAHLHRCVRRVIAEYRGIVVSYHGDGVMAMFGYPEPTEHDGHRAAAAAVALHHAFRNVAFLGVTRELPPLSLHTGVHCERIAAGESETDPGHYTLAGEATVAQRLSAKAKANEILVSTSTLGRDSHFFSIVERGPMTFDGKTKSVDVLQVLELSDAKTRFEARTQGGLSPFVGRARELAELDRHLHRVVKQEFREVTVSASAGVGKTRFVEEFLRGIPPGTVHVWRGYCENYLVSEPFQPFLQILRQLGSQDGGDDGSIATAVERAAAICTPTASAVSKAGEGAAEALCDVFTALCRESTVVLFIDDWQWADDATAQVLARLREMAPMSLLILTASREAVAANRPSSNVRVVDLKPLDRAETETIIRRLRPEADPFAVEQIQRLSGGNPLFIEELCHAAARLTTGSNRESGATVPAWLSRLIQSRVIHLASGPREVLEIAAVIGPTIPLWVLRRLTPAANDETVLATLAEEDLIYPAGDRADALRFKHGITRDAIYLSVTLGTCRSLHRAIAKILEAEADESGGGPPYEALSYHYREAGDRDEATHYAELAGDKARKSGAADRARSQYEYVLNTLPAAANYGRWSRIAHHFGLACVFDPSRDQVKDFNAAADLARAHADDAGLARAEYWLGFIHYAVGDLRDAIEHYARARVHCVNAIERGAQEPSYAEPGEMEALRVQILAAIGQARAAAGEHEPALSLLDEALNVKRPHRRNASPAVGSAYTLACKGSVLGDLGRFSEAYDCFAEACDVVRAGHPAVEASIHGWRSAVCLWQGNWESARQSAAQSQRLAERIGSLYVLAMGQAVAAYATWMLEKTTESIDVIARATSWLEARDKRLSISFAYGWLADIHAANGNVAETRRWAAKAIRRAAERDYFGEPMSYRALALLPARDAGKQPEDYLTRAIRCARARSPREEAVTLLHSGQHAARTGEHAEAVSLLDQARAAFGTMDMTWHDAVAQRSLRELAAGQPTPGSLRHELADRNGHAHGDTDREGRLARQ